MNKDKTDVDLAFSVLIIVLALLGYFALFSSLQNSQPKVNIIEHDNHTYLSFENGVVHNPNCQCHKFTLAEKF